MLFKSNRNYLMKVIGILIFALLMLGSFTVIDTQDQTHESLNVNGTSINLVLDYMTSKFNFNINTVDYSVKKQFI